MCRVGAPVAAAEADEGFFEDAVGEGCVVAADFDSFGAFVFAAFFAEVVAASGVGGAGTYGVTVGASSAAVAAAGVSTAGAAVGVVSAPVSAVCEPPRRSATIPTIPARTTAPIARRATGAPVFLFGAPLAGGGTAAFSAFAASSPIARPAVIVGDSASTVGVACVGVSDVAVASGTGGAQEAVSPVVLDTGASPRACRRSAASSAAP